MAEDAATPADYIADRQREHPRQAVTLEMVRQRIGLAGQIVEGVDLAAWAEEFNSRDYAQFLLMHISARLPKNVLDLLESGAIAVGEIDKPTFDARVVQIAQGHAIVISSGTHKFVYRIARILSTRFAPTGGGDPALAFEETARMVAEAFWWHLETGYAFGPEYPVTAEQLIIANQITLEAMAFLLCHEIGHAINDRDASAEYKMEVEVAPHLDEHGADFLGAMWTLGLGSGEIPPSATQMAIRYSGIEFVLVVWAALEKLGVEFSDSHPPAQERLAFVRLLLREKCDESTWETLTVIARGIEHIFERIGELIDDPSQHESFFEAQATAVMVELNALLERCVTIPVPDYATFYSEAGAIFGRGYPERLLERVAQISGEFFAKAESEEPWSRERIGGFHKFKLLLGFVQQLDEPARSLFQTALRLSSR